MTTKISGVRVVTPDDLSALKSELTKLGDRVEKLHKDAQARSEGNASKIRILVSDLRAQSARIDKLEGGLKQLRRTLNGIVQEAKRASEFLGEANSRLGKANETLDQTTASVRDHAQAEARRRQQLTEAMQNLLTHYEIQAESLQGAFADIRSQLSGLAEAEREGAKRIRFSINDLREGLMQLQAQTQEGLSRTTRAVHEFTKTKEAHALKEATAFQQLISVQESIQKRLDAIEEAASGLSKSSQEAKEVEERSLVQTSRRVAEEMNHQAALLLIRQDYRAAMLLLEVATQLAPEDIAILNNLALARLKAEEPQYGRVKDMLTEAVARDPESVAALDGLGVLHLDEGNAEEALIHLERAAELAPEDATIWMNLGKARFAVGAVSRAMEAWHQAYQLEPVLVSGDAEVRILLDEQETLLNRR